MSRFVWNPDCQEGHGVHDPMPDEHHPDSELTCAICGHTLDMVFVHVYEIDPDDPSDIPLPPEMSSPHVYDRAADSSAYRPDANPEDLCYVCGRSPDDPLHVGPHPGGIAQYQEEDR